MPRHHPRPIDTSTEVGAAAGAIAEDLEPEPEPDLAVAPHTPPGWVGNLSDEQTVALVEMRELARAELASPVGAKLAEVRGKLFLPPFDSIGELCQPFFSRETCILSLG